MKLLRCKIMKDVDNGKCYSCFTNGLSEESHVSRVLCKKANIIEEISLDARQEPVLVLEKQPV